MANRRVFIRQLSVLPFFTLPISGFTNGKVKTYQGERRTLEEAGPMIPPVPAILLSVKGVDSNPAEISVVWTFVVNGNPPQIGISVGDEHVARDIIKTQKQFVLNVPSASMVESFDKVDMNSSKIADKFELSGLTMGKATSVDAPTIEEAPIQVECRVSHELRVPPERTVFIADVTATTVLPNVCDENGRLIVENVDFFGMTAGSGEFYTMGEKVGYIGKSVGRDDIKY